MTSTIGGQAVVAIERRNSVAFVRAMLDCYASDAIALPLVPGAPAAVAGLALHPPAPSAEGGGWFEPRQAPRHDAAAAQITLTSGTTGAPKPILLPHRALGDVTRRLIDAQGLDENVREYVAVPVVYSFGLGRARAIAAVGGAGYIPPAGFRIDELAQMLRDGEVNALAAVPTQLRLILQQANRLGDVGRNLRWLEIGSQAMSRAEKEAVKALFPAARIVQHYGLTEASRSTFLDISRESGAALDSVGRPTGAVEIAIADDGLIRVRGPHVADGVLTEEGVTPLTDADGWLTTSDLGAMIDGRLRFDGRADDLINVAGVKVPAGQFEERLFARLPPGADVAVAGGPDVLRGERVLVALGPGMRGQEEAARAAAGQVATELNVGEGYALVALPEIPRTDTGKVQRRRIAALHAQQTASSPASAAGGDPAVVEIFVHAFGERARDESATFNALHGDSLSYVAVASALEARLPDLPEDWETRTIGALSAMAAAPRPADAAQRAPRIPANLDTLRGMACLLVVAFHVVGMNDDSGLRLPDGSIWRHLADGFQYLRLPLFTAMAGFLYAAMPVTREGFGPFVARKARQLAVPMLFATLVMWGARSAIGRERDTLLTALSQGYLHLWFIYALLLMFLLAAIIDSVGRPSWRPWLAILLVAPIAASTLPHVGLLSIGDALRLLPNFALGILLYRLPALLRSRHLPVIAGLAAGGALTVQQLMLWQVLPPTALPWWLPHVGGWAAVLCLLFAFPKLVPLERIAAYSYTIYLWHPPANAAVRNLLWKMGFADMTALVFGLGLLGGILLPILLHRAVSRFPAISLPVIGR